jgi:hypothetical protein
MSSLSGDLITLPGVFGLSLISLMGVESAGDGSRLRFAGDANAVACGEGGEEGEEEERIVESMPKVISLTSIRSITALSCSKTGCIGDGRPSVRSTAVIRGTCDVMAWRLTTTENPVNGAVDITVFDERVWDENEVCMDER